MTGFRYRREIVYDLSPINWMQIIKKIELRQQAILLLGDTGSLTKTETSFVWTNMTSLCFIGLLVSKSVGKTPRI
jgi:hypothetical protein